MATELIVALWQSFNDRVRKSPIEMFEGGVGQSPTKLENIVPFKTWISNTNRYYSENLQNMHPDHQHRHPTNYYDSNGFFFHHT